MYNFSIVSYLDKELTKKVREIQKNIFDLTGSRACMETWEPHITIGPGINIEKKDLVGFYKNIKDIASKHTPFKVRIKNYRFMDDWVGGALPEHTKYVVYLDVIINKNLLDLVENIKKLTEKNPGVYYRPWPYNPHLTVAYKDLSEEGFLKVKNLIKSQKFNSETVINHISLTKQDKNGKWKNFKKFKLNHPTEKAIEEKISKK